MSWRSSSNCEGKRPREEAQEHRHWGERQGHAFGDLRWLKQWRSDSLICFGIGLHCVALAEPDQAGLELAVNLPPLRIAGTTKSAFFVFVLVTN